MENIAAICGVAYLETHQYNLGNRLGNEEYSEKPPCIHMHTHTLVLYLFHAPNAHNPPHSGVAITICVHLDRTAHVEEQVRGLGTLLFAAQGVHTSIGGHADRCRVVHIARKQCAKHLRWFHAEVLPGRVIQQWIPQTSGFPAGFPLTPPNKTKQQKHTLTKSHTKWVYLFWGYSMFMAF